MIKHNAKLFFAILILGIYPLVLQATDIHGEMKILADSAINMLGQKQLPAVNARWMKLAKQQNDTTQIVYAYNNLTSHYYQLGDIDSLQKYTYEYMDWCEKYNYSQERYTSWRQYIQRMTEKGMQEEAMAETAKLHDDAKNAKDKYGLACGEMCIGYNHRVFGNNVQLCIESYNNALKLFEEGDYYRDANVVLLNIIQTHLSRSEYVDAENYLNKLTQLEDKMNRKKIAIDPSLHLRFCEFRVISLLANKGKEAAEPFIKETDKYYRQNPGSSTLEAWYGYKIMCCRILGDLKENIAYVDSLMNYQKSLGLCYPYNYYMKAQLQEQLGDYHAACRNYSLYATVNDSVRTAELDDKLSKYTAQFEVDRLKMEKLELSAKLSRERLVVALVAGGLIFLLLLIITYLYVRTLSMNRKLKVARLAVHKMSHVKSSFIQHITHEIRTPLNSIVGFSTLLSEGGLDEPERIDYAAQVESNNIYLLGLMENILIIADMDSLAVDKPREVVNIDACIRECAGELRSVLKPEVKLECMPMVDTSTIFTVHSWLKIVLMSLLDNAVKFTEKGYIRISCSEDKSHRILRIMIEDTGIGLRPEEAEHIFERFFKVDLFTKGSGLGLAIAHEITEMVGGRVYWDSTYQDGCRFVIEWPMSDKP
ncbi:HAMP domain-containing sensor histidine kinase [Bacteroides sp.]|uniref:sensor histidine kinase n=1 Tax=Bacteroides sp. TaxID=29523 RepID=UPI002630FF56|nr:HAMP domain-containing sensor histidine kinase [Bacteroides sp.]